MKPLLIALLLAITTAAWAGDTGGMEKLSHKTADKVDAALAKKESLIQKRQMLTEWQERIKTEYGNQFNVVQRELNVVNAEIKTIETAEAKKAEKKEGEKK